MSLLYTDGTNFYCQIQLHPCLREKRAQRLAALLKWCTKRCGVCVLHYFSLSKLVLAGCISPTKSTINGKIVLIVVMIKYLARAFGGALLYFSFFMPPFLLEGASSCLGRFGQIKVRYRCMHTTIHCTWAKKSIQ